MQDFLPFRQVHLDFHTHQAIEGIGADFDPEEFAGTLEKARVNSINIFARGHHGYVYYRTEAFADRMHPHLSRDLLRQQIEACHERGIRAPVYITVQWDALTAWQHPEWLVVDEYGKPRAHGLYEPGFYQRICLNTPYVDFLKAFTQDVLDHLPVDGLWYDIVAACDCSCRWCRQGMLDAGLDPSDAQARRHYGVEVLHRFQQGMTDFVRRQRPDCMIFYNAGHVGPMHRPMLDAYSHLEIESLPSGGWGYMHYPITARYARTLGKDFLGMTGKFHTAWGDFHSFKTLPALEFECFTMLALNGKCSVGDQLHPRGQLCPHTYDLIGAVYEQVEAREPWCRNAQPVVDIGVLTPEEKQEFANQGGIPKAIMGVTRILQETHHQFDIIDSKADLSRYKVLILPDEITVTPEFAARIEAYLAGGGALLATHQSGLDEAGIRFLLPLGVDYAGAAPFTPMFVRPREAMANGLAPTEHVMYLTGTQVSAGAGADILADNVAPYFNRTWEHYCSHRHAPSSGEGCGPAIVRQCNAIYMAQPVFTQYAANAPGWCRQLVANALDLLLPEPTLRVDAPTTLTCAVNDQPAENRRVVHLLHYVPVRNNDAFDTISDVYPLADLAVSLKVPGKVKAVTRVPENEGLGFTQEDGRVHVVLPRLVGSQMLAVEWE